MVMFVNKVFKIYFLCQRTPLYSLKVLAFLKSFTLTEITSVQTYFNLNLIMGF
jgi:hypothetical protein